MPSAPAKPRPPWSARVSRAEFRVLAELPSHSRVRPLAPTPKPDGETPSHLEPLGLRSFSNTPPSPRPPAGAGSYGPRSPAPRTVLITLRVMPSAPAKPRPPWSARVSRAEFRVLAELPSSASVRPLAPTPLRIGTMRPTLPPTFTPSPRPGRAQAHSRGCSEAWRARTPGPRLTKNASTPAAPWRGARNPRPPHRPRMGHRRENPSEKTLLCGVPISCGVSFLAGGWV